jgi:hypothetical protein
MKGCPYGRYPGKNGAIRFEKKNESERMQGYGKAGEGGHAARFDAGSGRLLDI